MTQGKQANVERDGVGYRHFRRFRNCLRMTTIPRWCLVTGAVLLITAAQWLISVLSRLTLGPTEIPADPLGKYPLAIQLVIGAVVAPFYETLIFQWACIRLLRRLRLEWRSTALVATILFGLAHGIYGRWLLGMFVTGGILAMVFITEARRTAGHPFWMTFAVHALFNALVFAMTSWG